MDDADEQNEQDNENVDEQDSDDEEEEAAAVAGEGEGVESEDEYVEDGDVRVFHVGYNNYYYRQQFEIDCRRIERNDPDFRSFYCPYSEFIVLNDSRAVLLGKALLGNTNMNYLWVAFTQRAGFTSQGAKAFVEGIQGSQIKTLDLVGIEELPMEISQLCAKSIENIHLHFPMGDEFAIHISEALAASKLLGSITIRVDQMTPRGAQGLSKFLRASSITSLTFIVPEDNFVTPSVMQTLYLEGVQHCKDIREIYLENTMDDMHALATVLPKLHQLCIKDIDISLSNVELLAHGLSNANQLHTLNLEQCSLNDEHMSILSPILGSHLSIKNVTLENNLIGDEGKVFGDAGITSFVEHWHPESKIENLTLSSNDIGFKGAVMLIKASSNHPTPLRSLTLSDIKSIGFDGIKMIGDALPGTKIQTLKVDCEVYWSDYENVDGDAAVIRKEKCMAACDALLEGVRRNLHLRKLKLPYFFHMPATLKEKIDLYFDANALGRCGVLEQSHVLPAGVWSHFFAKRKMTSCLLFFFLRELPGVVVVGARNHTIGRKRRRL